MIPLINNVGPLVLIFAIGQLLYRIGFLKPENADLMLRLFFYLALPAMILLSIPKIPLTPQLLYFPLTMMLIFFVNWGLARAANRYFRLDRKTKGVFLIGSMSINGAFAFPFVAVSFSEQALGMAYLFDFGNAIVTLSIAYYLACRYGASSKVTTGVYRKFISSPPLLALFLAILLNLTGLPLPPVATELLRNFSNLATPLIMLSLGVYFNPKIVNPGALLTVIGLRFIGGLSLGLLFVTLFGLTGIGRTIVLVMAVCPSAMNTLTYAAMENLDKQFAASIVSYTTLISMFLMPLMIYLQS